VDKKKYVLHIDMDAYFASVEEKNNSKLCNKPLIVSGMNSNSVVSTANYAARKYGIKSAMPVYIAKKLCPQLIIKKPHFLMYEKYHQEIIKYIKKNYSNIIEIASIDECYVDISHLVNNSNSPFSIAKKIQGDIFKKMNLPCSIGISENKFLAKMACKLIKPFGINLIYTSDVEDKL
jgi:DNA polymerase-4